MLQASDKMRGANIPFQLLLNFPGQGISHRFAEFDPTAGWKVMSVFQVLREKNPIPLKNQGTGDDSITSRPIFSHASQ